MSRPHSRIRAVVAVVFTIAVGCGEATAPSPGLVREQVTCPPGHQVFFFQERDLSGGLIADIALCASDYDIDIVSAVLMAAKRKVP